ncbi:MAG: hypothetical protein ACI9FN_003551 [Saprospiraceae bacterium]
MNWALVREKLIPKIASIDDDQLLIEFHLFNQEIKEAATIINKSKSWKTIQEYDELIVDINAEEGYILYLDYILDYLKDHFGAVAAQHLEVVLIRARRLGSDKWVRKLETQIQSVFPHRDW